MKNNLFFACCIALVLCIPAVQVNAQGVAFNATGAAADGSAMVDVSSTAKGMLIPRMTHAQIAAIPTPATGLMAYQTDGAVGLYYYNGTAWVSNVGAASGTTNYLSKFTSASTLGNSLVFDNGTSVGIGISTPSSNDKFTAFNSSTAAFTSGIHAVSGSYAGGAVGTDAGVLSESNTGIGIVGVSSGASAIYGWSMAPSYSGVFGTNTAGGFGVWGTVTSTGAAGYFDGGTSGGYGVVVNQGNSGFGTTTPAAANMVDVLNPSSSSIANGIHSVVGAAPTSFTVFEPASFYGETNAGIGVIAVSTQKDGVYAVTSAGAGNAGVTGYNSGAGGYGVWGIANGGGGSVGGYFDGGTSGGYGIIVPNGTSGFGTTAPTSNAKVEVTGVGAGGATTYYQAGIVADGATTASASGVFGQAGWRGVFGYNNASSGGSAAIGTQGTVAGGSSYTTGYGVYGSATGTGPTNYGVYGTASSGSVNYAGYFQGALFATSASSSIKSFKIDDPRDPANKYLYHSSVESNEMMDLYKGHVTTDASGEATVTLPSYFNALNMDFDYQLTCIGQFAQAIVSEEIVNNQFKIKTDHPGVKVSWQVSGVRKDPAAIAYRVKDEVEKPASEKGTYLMPELYGYGPEKAPGYLNEKTNGTQPSSTQAPTPTTSNNQTGMIGGAKIGPKTTTAQAPTTAPVNKAGTVGGIEITKQTGK